MFENYLEASFLLQVVSVEFGVLDFEFLQYIGICDGDFTL